MPRSRTRPRFRRPSSTATPSPRSWAATCKRWRAASTASTGHSRPPGFRQRLMPPLIEPLLEPVAHELIDRFEPRGRADLVAEFTRAYPAKIILAMLGLPQHAEDDVTRWALGMLDIQMHYAHALLLQRSSKTSCAHICTTTRQSRRRSVVEARDRGDRRTTPDRHRDLCLLEAAVPRRRRHDLPRPRQHHLRAVEEPRSTRPTRRRSFGCARSRGGRRAMEPAGAAAPSPQPPRRRVARRSDPGGNAAHLRHRGGQSRPGGVRRRRSFRHRPARPGHADIRFRGALLPGRPPCPRRATIASAHRSSNDCRACASTATPTTCASADRSSSCCADRTNCRCASTENCAQGLTTTSPARGLPNALPYLRRRFEESTQLIALLRAR